MSSIDDIINSSNRVVGLMSSIDSDAQIKKLLSGDQTKIDNQNKKKQILEWKREDYRDINTKLLAVRNSLFDLKLSSTFTGKKVTSSDEKTLTATANGDAVPGTYDITVQKAATRASLNSTAALGSNSDKSTIAKQFQDFGITDTTHITFTIQGQDGVAAFDFDAKDATMDEIVTCINDENIGVNAYYDETLDRFFLTSNEYGKNAEISIKVDSMADSTGNKIGTGSFLNDCLKLSVDYSSSNETSPGNGRVISSSKSIATTPPATTDSLAILYAGDTIPTTIYFTLEGSLGKHDFSFTTATTTLQQFVDGINNEQNSTGIIASYDTTNGMVSLNDSTPLAALDTGSTATAATLTFNEALYTSSDGTSSGTLTALTEGQLIDTANFTYTGSGTLTSATYHLNGDGTARIDFVVSGASAGDTVKLNGGTSSIFDAQANQYQPQSLTCAADANSWTYPTTARTIAIRKDTQDFLSDKLNLVMDSQKGTGAIITYNGTPDLEFDSNQFTMNNINYTISSNAVAGTAVSLTVTNDVDKAVEKIKAFVDAYNSAMTLINSKLNETREIEDHAVKYQPLTDDEKEEMTDDQITKWETYARKGLMKNESILQSAASSLRSIASTIIRDKVADAKVESTDDLVDYVDSTGKLVSKCQYRSLSAIGISTGSYQSSSNDNATLIIDEDQLREALTTDAEAVNKLFSLTQTDKTTSTDYNVGIAQQLYDAINTSMSQITTKAGSASSSYDNSQLAKEIYQIDDKIYTLVDRMETQSDRYYTQFAAMEEALQKLSSQSSWIAQQMGSSS